VKGKSVTMKGKSAAAKGQTAAAKGKALKADVPSSAYVLHISVYRILTVYFSLEHHGAPTLPTRPRSRYVTLFAFRCMSLKY
jgi:hypothetical protein